MGISELKKISPALFSTCSIYNDETIDDQLTVMGVPMQKVEKQHTAGPDNSYSEILLGISSISLTLGAENVP